MNIPYWLLRLLPMWDYICPKCRREVKRKSGKCPYCSENYGVPLRIPPKVLKDTKALEDYVHKHVFPKVSASQREYLTRFFTTIFSDGFESGNFSKWTDTDVYGTVINIVTTLPHHGTYCAEISDLNNAGEYGIIREVFGSTYTELDARGYVYFDNTLYTFTEVRGLLNFRSTNEKGFGATLRNSGGNYIWRCFNDVTGLNYDSSIFSFNVKTWYCIEIHVLISNTIGAIQLWVNGALTVNATGLNTGSSNISTLWLEAYHNTGNSGVGIVRFDCIVVADAYIGEEAIAKAFSDIGGGSEAFGIPFKALPFADAGQGAEAFNTPFRSMKVSDVGHGVEAFNTPFRSMKVSDVGHGVEAFNTPFRAMGFDDSGAGIDVFTLLRAMSFSDVGHGAESFSQIITFLNKVFADAGHGTDIFTLLRALAFADVAHGTDTFLILLKALGFSDVSHGTDAFIIPYRAMEFSDSGHGTDSFLIVFKTVFFSDSGYGSDSFAYYNPALVKITKLFLVIGDLAIQIAGD